MTLVGVGLLLVGGLTFWRTVRRGAAYRDGPWPGLSPAGAVLLIACAVLLAGGQLVVGEPHSPFPDLPLLAALAVGPLALATRLVAAPGVAAAVSGAYLLPRALLSLIDPSMELPMLLLVPALAFDVSAWLRAGDVANLVSALPGGRSRRRRRHHPEPRSAQRTAPGMSHSRPDVTPEVTGGQNATADVTLANPHVTPGVTLAEPDVTLAEPDVTLARLRVTLARLRVTLARLRVTLARPRVTLARLRVTLARLHVTLARLHVTFARLHVTLARLHVTFARLHVTPGVTPRFYAGGGRRGTVGPRRVAGWRAVVAGAVFGGVLAVTEPPFVLLLGGDPAVWSGSALWLAGGLSMLGCAIVALAVGGRGTAR